MIWRKITLCDSLRLHLGRGLGRARGGFAPFLANAESSLFRFRSSPVSLDYEITKWARLFLSGRNVTDAQKLAVREVTGSPFWSTFAAASNLGVPYTVGITGAF